MEGKNRQIRRMVKKMGNRVVHLHRIRVADLKLGRLAKGSWRYLNPGEIRRLLTQLQLT
jgi:pseudouridine synthase